MNAEIFKQAVRIVRCEHPDYADSEYFYIREHELYRNSESRTDNLMQIINKYIGEYEECRTRVIESVQAAIKYKSRIWGVPMIFDEDGYNRLKELRSIVEDSEDDNFVFIFKEQRLAVGIYQFCDPVLIVIDVDHETPLHNLVYNTETGKFEVVERGCQTYLQCFDIYDNLSVGEPFIIDEKGSPMPMHEAAEDICHQMADRYLLKDCSVVNVDGNDPDKDKELNLINEFMSGLDIRTCRTCENKFVLTADEKNWYDEKQFSYPKSCAYCRNAKREEARRKARIDAQRALYREYLFDDE